MESKQKKSRRLVIGDVVNVFKNSTNNQFLMIVGLRKIRKFGYTIEDLMNTPLKKKLKKFEEGE